MQIDFRNVGLNSDVFDLLIFLDGKSMTHVVAASEEEGWIDELRPDVEWNKAHGNTDPAKGLVHGCMIADEATGHAKTFRRFGVVTIRQPVPIPRNIPAIHVNIGKGMTAGDVARGVAKSLESYRVGRDCPIIEH